MHKKKLRNGRRTASTKTPHCPSSPMHNITHLLQAFTLFPRKQFPSKMNRILIVILCALWGALLAISASSAGPPLSDTTLQVEESVQEYEIFPEVFHSPDAFKLSYKKMEEKFGVYVYPDGDPNFYYDPPRKTTGKYASERYFLENLRENDIFRTDNPDKAHLFFIPISCHKLRGTGVSYEEMATIVQNYVQNISTKYPYWNRTLGADHFFVTCHDIGVRATEGVPQLVKNSIRVVCSSNYDTGYIPHKDVALPAIMEPFALPAHGNDINDRTILGFWAGRQSSELRNMLVSVWQNDTELDIQTSRVYGRRGKIDPNEKFFRAKYCICPRGSEAAMPFIAKSIKYGCVPVIMSDKYDLPFNDILDWSKFSVRIREDDVYQLKDILKGITDEEFKELHENTVKVQGHFRWSSPPAQYDAFHMALFELWQRRHVARY